MPRRLLGVLLLLLVSVAKIWAQGDVILRIGDTPVSRSEFQYYFDKNKSKALDAYLASFVDYKLKVQYAKDCGIDTLPAFRMQLSYYQNKLLKYYLVNAEKEEQEARLIYERNKQRLQTNDWVRIAHISKYLPQNLSATKEKAAKQQMDSIYAALVNGGDFASLARKYSDDAESKEEGGILPWMPIHKNMQEWIDKLMVLEKEKISVPFYSPMGIHIVKWLDRKPFAAYEDKLQNTMHVIENEGINSPAIDKDSWASYLKNDLDRKYPELSLRMQEIYDGLLASCVSQKHQVAEVVYQEDDLERFFKQHKSAYSWDLPHYRGAVIHCKDKKEASIIKKHLKKKSVSEWQAKVEELVANKAISFAEIEAGLFPIGKNKCIDKLVFKCGSFVPASDEAYLFVMGKKLKKGPESYKDVRDKVVGDYRAVYEDAWLKDLKQKYKVEINQEVIKTVNNNRSN